MFWGEAETGRAHGVVTNKEREEVEVEEEKEKMEK